MGKEKNPFVITIATEKGGVGKSTIATNLAVCFAKDKYKVELIDTDVQKSSYSFSLLREKNDFEATTNFSDNLYKEIKEKKEVDIIIIDAGGRDSSLFRSAILATQYNGMLLIPLLASQIDILSFESTLKIVREVKEVIEDLKVAVVLNMVNERAKKTTSALEYLEEKKANKVFDVFDTRLHNLIDYKNAFEEGLGVTELTPVNNKVKKEFDAFYKELKKKI